jgi:hypothetical protein
MWLIGMAVSLGLFAVIYFTVIQPDNKAANQALKTGLQQSQQAINQAQQQLSTAASQASTTEGQVSSTAANQASSAVTGAQKTISKAQKLAACVSAAGTDVGKIQACQAKF